MKRLKLEVEELAVMSFATAPVPAGRGTVHAHATSLPRCPVQTGNCTINEPECVVTGGINSCWCTEYVSCGCTVAVE